MLLTVTQPNSWEQCPVLLLDQTWALLEARRAHTPQPSCVIWTHFRAKTSPPSPWGWAHAHCTCGRTRFPPQITWYPHACIFTHAGATGHTPAWPEQKAQDSRKAVRHSDTAAPIHRPHLMSSGRDSKQHAQKALCISLFGSLACQVHSPPAAQGGRFLSAPRAAPQPCSAARGHQ